MQRDESHDGRRSLGSCCPEDSTVWCRLPRTRGPQSLVLNDTTDIITSVWGGAWEPQSGFPDGVGGRWVGRRLVLKVFGLDVPLTTPPASVHRQSSRDDISVEIPQVLFFEKVVETVQKTVEVLQLRSSTRWTMSRLCRTSFGVSRTVEVPQIQIIAGVCGHSRSQQRRVCFQRGYGGGEGFFWRFFRIFRAPPGRLELSGRFRGLGDEEFFSLERGSLAN